MKKLFAVLLLALLICQVFGFEDQFDYIVEDAKKWFKRNGHLDDMTKLLHSSGRTAAIEYCKQYFKEKICAAILDKL